MNETNILINMYYSGLVNRETNIMSVFKVDNDFTIEMERKDALQTMFSSYSSFKYHCYIRFKDSLGRELICLDMSEVDAFIMIDNLSEYLSTCYIFDEFLVSNIRSTILGDKDKYALSVHTVYNNEYKSGNRTTIFKLDQFNETIGQAFNKISITFDDEKLSYLSDLVFWTFLVDITDGPVSEKLLECDNL